MQSTQRILSRRSCGVLKASSACLFEAGFSGGRWQGNSQGQGGPSHSTPHGAGSPPPPLQDQPESKRVPLKMFLTMDEHTSSELRERLNKQRSVRASRGTTLETESKLIIQLARSPHAKERLEALERGETLWEELGEESDGIPLPTRTAMKVTMCSALRRCALMSKLPDVADLWTERFAVRASSIRPDDFNQQPTFSQGGGPGPHGAAADDEDDDQGTLGWRQARARPGTGLTEEDLEEDAKERAQARQRARHTKEQSPIQQLRHDVLLDHPTVEYAFKKTGGPGPRYTG